MAADKRWWRAAGLAAVGVVALLFWGSPWLLPLKLLVVLFHELGHATMAWLTGGEVLEIQLSADQGGLARTRGGNAFLILNAGYLGSLVAGVAMLVLGRRPRTARPVMAVLAAALVVIAVLFTPWLSFAFFFTLAASVVLLAVVRWAPHEATAFATRGIGVFSVLYALWDIRSDVLSWNSSGGTSDATVLAELTHIPAVVWGGLWIAAGVLVLILLRRRIV